MPAPTISPPLAALAERVLVADGAMGTVPRAAELLHEPSVSPV